MANMSFNAIREENSRGNLRIYSMALVRENSKGLDAMPCRVSFHQGLH